MEELSVALVAVWAMLIAPGLVLALSTKDVRVDQIEVAYKVCEPHGGLAKIDGTVMQGTQARTVDVTCRDGAYISAPVPRKESR